MISCKHERLGGVMVVIDLFFLGCIKGLMIVMCIF